MLVLWLTILAGALGAWPVAHLVGLRARGERIALQYWWVAAALGVSFVADLVGALGFWSSASQVYPLSQAGILAAVLATTPREERWAVGFIGLLVASAVASATWRQGEGRDVLLHTVAYLGIAAMARATLRAPTMMRVTLVWGFPLLALAWLAYASDPSFLTWSLTPSIRVAMAAGFIMAVREARGAAS